MPANESKQEEYVETCCVVDTFCESPANAEKPHTPKSRCFNCNRAVCTKCSSRRQFYNWLDVWQGRVRLCNDCQVEYDGHDKLVMARLQRLAIAQPKAK